MYFNRNSFVDFCILLILFFKNFFYSHWTTAASAKRFHGPPSSRVRLSSPWQQQWCPGGEGSVPADGRGSSLFCYGLPQLLLPFLPPCQQSSRACPWRRLIWAGCRKLLSRLQPGRRLPALQQLWLWRRLRLWCIWLRRICFLVVARNCLKDLFILIRILVLVFLYNMRALLLINHSMGYLYVWFIN